MQACGHCYASYSGRGAEGPVRLFHRSTRVANVYGMVQFTVLFFSDVQTAFGNCLIKPPAIFAPGW